MGCGSSSATGVKNTKVDVKKLHKKTGLPLPFIENKYEQFLKLDSDGKINKDHFVDLFVHEDDDDLKKFVKQMFKAFDTDKSGKMDFNEIMLMLGVVLKGSTLERLKAVFTICDEDRSGRIEKDELVHTFKNLSFLVRDDGVDKDGMEDLAKVTFEAIDKDNNGHLTKEEFLNSFAANERVEHMVKAIFVGAAEALIKH